MAALLPTGRLSAIALGLLTLAAIAAAQVAPAKLTPAQLRSSGDDHFFNLEYSAAASDFQLACTMQPDSAADWNHLAEARLYQELFRVGALASELYGHGDPFLVEKQLPPDPTAVASFLAANQRAQNLAAAAIARDPRDVHAHYNLAVAWAMHGTYEFTLSKSYLAALADARKARAEAARAAALDPDFIDPQLILGVQNYVAGSLPWTMRAVGTIVGYRGDRARGIAQIHNVAEHGETSRDDAQVLLAVIDRRDGENQEAASLLSALAARYPRNFLFAVESAEASEAAGDHQLAQQLYHQVLDRSIHHAPGFEQAPLDKVWYDLGNIERLESHWPEAIADFRQAEAVPDALPRYRQAAALAAGESELALGNPAAAQREFQTCVSINPDTPAGHEAQRRIHP